MESQLWTPVGVVQSHLVALATWHFFQANTRGLTESIFVTQVDECAGALIRALSRAEEDLAPCLPLKKRGYLFGSLGFAAARTIMWLLPELGVSVPAPSWSLFLL